MSIKRRFITISGIVQGVGFRPFVYALASELKLAGWVCNQSGQVWIEVQGPESPLSEFTERLRGVLPPLARIDELVWTVIPTQEDACFEILASRDTVAGKIFVSPDVSTCADCLRELFDPADRRFGYPFANCTRCGPRLTIIRRAPYDRALTTMSGFTMCALCRSEYENPADRRFHAQPIACPTCGPRLQLLDARGKSMQGDDLIGTFCRLIREGAIGALKGLGGYHLVCSADNDDAVYRLRQRKQRDEKPFAIMLPNAGAAAKWCQLNAQESELLRSWRRPIVLLRKRSGVGPISQAVAPQNPYLGVMLPYTPLHELLFAQWGEKPLVVTSGNRSDEPIAVTDDDALQRLGAIADHFLMHNRPIRVRCDDSVTRIMAGTESLLRRSRGYAPLPLKLPEACPAPCLAVGGQHKNVFALAQGENAFLSHHIGDLDELAALQAFQQDIELYEQLFEIEPQWIVHDMHPDYTSTAYALTRAGQVTGSKSLRTMPVQHHHAHMASCMAEHGLDGQVIGVVLDGSGYGLDGTIWGGEILIGGYADCVRGAHFSSVRLPGGELAIKQPWRMAVSYLQAAGCDVDRWLNSPRLPLPSEYLDRKLNTRVSFPVDGVRQMLRSGFNSPWTSSAGRLFDAVAALIGVRPTVSFEGQAAMQLETLASSVADDQLYDLPPPGAVQPALTNQSLAHPAIIIDTLPLIRSIASDYEQGVDVAVIAHRFHHTLATMLADTCLHLATVSGLQRVILSGGVFMNAVLSMAVTKQLIQRGLVPYQHRLVPTNDGGLSLGQLAIAAHRLQCRANAVV